MATKKPVSVYSGKLKELQSGDVLSYDAIGALATARLVGRSTAGTGALEAISIGSGLSLSAGTLSATGGGLSIGSAVSGGGANRVLYEDGSQNLAASANLTFDGNSVTAQAGTSTVPAVIVVAAASATAPFLQYKKNDGTIYGHLRSNDETNLFIGKNTGNGTLSGLNNVGFGISVLGSVTTGFQNFALGSYAMASLTDGYQNVALGVNALRFGTSANLSIAIGDSALINATSSSNLAIGASSLSGLTSGNNNVAIGAYACTATTSGSDNVFIGYRAGRLCTGSSNVFVGADAGYNETNSNRLYIANSSTSTPLIYGEFPNTALYVTAPTYRQRYDASNYLQIAVGSTGAVTFDAVGSGAKFIFSDCIEPPSMADSSAPNNSIYYSTTQNKLVFKDGGGVVNNLY